MNELQVISQQQILGNSFSIFGTTDEPLFLAKEVAEMIDYSWTNSKKTARKTGQMLATVDDDEKLKATVRPLQCSTPSLHGGVRENTEMWFLTENGLYEVLMQSRKPIAKTFKKEVKKILKDIRKHGAYMTDNVIEQVLSDPDTLIKLAVQLKESRAAQKAAEAEVAALAEENATMQPKVVFADAVTASHTTILIRDLAKLITQNGYPIGEKRLFEWLRSNGFLIRKQGKDYNSPTQYSMERGLMEINETTVVRSAGIEIKKTPKITGKGQQYFIKKFLESGV